MPPEPGGGRGVPDGATAGDDESGSSWRMHEKVPVRSTTITRCQFSMVLAVARLPCSPSMPAALNAASSRP